MARHNQDTEKALLSLIAGAIGFLALVLVLLELLPDNGDVRVTDLRVGGAVLSTADITQRVEEAVRTVDHVVNVKASVKAKREGRGCAAQPRRRPGRQPRGRHGRGLRRRRGHAREQGARGAGRAAASAPALPRAALQDTHASRSRPSCATPPADEDPKDAVMRIAAAPPEPVDAPG